MSHKKLNQYQKIVALNYRQILVASFIGYKDEGKERKLVYILNRIHSPNWAEYFGFLY